jgi:hypothetical protein
MSRLSPGHRRLNLRRLTGQLTDQSCFRFTYLNSR